jgi:hypothetical protein
MQTRPRARNLDGRIRTAVSQRGTFNNSPNCTPRAGVAAELDYVSHLQRPM